MSKDHKKESVLELAEQIFIHTIKPDLGREQVELYASRAIQAAMIFREEEDKIFGEKNE